MLSRLHNEDQPLLLQLLVYLIEDVKRQLGQQFRLVRFHYCHHTIAAIKLRMSQ